MFSDSKIASEFHLERNKLSYLISEAVGPHFYEVMMLDIKNSNSPYCISYDKLSNKSVRKQLDLKIRYWSEQRNLVSVHHLDSHFMGQAKGKI